MSGFVFETCTTTAAAMFCICLPAAAIVPQAFALSGCQQQAIAIDRFLKSAFDANGVLLAIIGGYMVVMLIGQLRKYWVDP